MRAITPAGKQARLRRPYIYPVPGAGRILPLPIRCPEVLNFFRRTTGDLNAFVSSKSLLFAAETILRSCASFACPSGHRQIMNAFYLLAESAPHISCPSNGTASDERLQWKWRRQKAARIELLMGTDGAQLEYTYVHTHRCHDLQPAISRCVV